MRRLLLISLLAFACAPFAWANGLTFNCTTPVAGLTTVTGTNVIALQDIVLTGTDVVNFSGCNIYMANQAWWSDSTWTGSYTLTNATMFDCGRQAWNADCTHLDMTSATATINWTGSTFRRSAGHYASISGADNLTYTNNNLCAQDNILPIAVDRAAVHGGDANYCLSITGTTTGTRSITGNTWYGGRIDTSSDVGARAASPGWTITDNRAWGYRAGIWCGTNSTCSTNYVNSLLGGPTPQQPYYVENWTFTCEAGSTCDGNVIRKGHWILRNIRGTFSNGVVLEQNGITSLQGLGGDTAGIVTGNIFTDYFQQQSRYTDLSCYNAQNGNISFTNPNNNFTIYNNTFDGGYPCAPQTAIEVVSGSHVNEVSNNAFVRTTSTLGNLHATVGAGMNSNYEPVGSPPYPQRADKLDYNFFNYVSGQTPQNYAIGITGRAALCSNQYGLHDLPSCPNGNASLTGVFQGADGNGSLPIGFPYYDTDIMAGTVTVQQVLNFYHYAYAPKAGSPLIGSGDPAHLANIGAVQSSPSQSSLYQSGVNQKPVVYSNMSPGGGFTINGLVANLSAGVSDDGLPNGTLTIAWTTLTKPTGATVTFTQPAKSITSATVTKYGTYVFQVTGSDGALTASDTITVVYLLPHPREYLADAAVVARVRAKAAGTSSAGNNADWTAMKSTVVGNQGKSLDTYVNYNAPTVTISSATNANPVVFTSSGTLPWTGSSLCYFGGAFGKWSPLNTPLGTSKTCNALTTTSFSVTGMDSTSWGSYSTVNPQTGVAQNAKLTLFLRNPTLPNLFTWESVNIRGADWYYPLVRLALAYQANVVTNPTLANTYAAAAQRLLEYINTITIEGAMMAPLMEDAYYADRFAIEGVALAFDWLRPYMVTDARASPISGLPMGQYDIGRTMTTLQMWFTAINIYRDQAGNLGSGPYGSYATADMMVDNYYAGHVGAGVLTAFAVSGDLAQPTGEFPQATPIFIDPFVIWKYWVANQMDVKFPDCFTTAPVAGGTFPHGLCFSGVPTESYGYGAGTLSNYAKSTFARKTATNGVEDFTANYIKPMADSVIYETAPNNWETTRHGDYPGASGIVSQSFCNLLTGTLQGLTEAGWMNFYCANQAAATLPSGVTANQAVVEDKMLWHDTAFTSTDYTLTQPSSSYSQGDEHHIIRSSWAGTANWAVLYGQTLFTNVHTTSTPGDLTLVRGIDNLIIPAYQWQDNNGVTGNPYNFLLASGYASNLYFYDGGTFGIFNPASASSYLYEGSGARLWGTYTPPVVPDKLATNYAHALVDLTQGYMPNKPLASRTLRYWYRDFVWLGGGTYGVYDRTKATAATYAGIPFITLAFCSGGLCDAATSGSYTGTQNETYDVAIDGTAVGGCSGNDSFKWSVNKSAYTTGVCMTPGTVQAIGANGTKLTFTGGIGHTLGQFWTFYAVAQPQHFRFHLNPTSTTTLASNTIKSVVGTSAMWIQPVSPATAQASIGWTPSATGDNQRGATSGFGASSFFTPRADIMNTAAPATDAIMTAVTTDASGASAPVAVDLTTLGALDANWAGMQITGTSDGIAKVYATGAASTIVANGAQNYTVTPLTSISTLHTTHAGTGAYMLSQLAPGVYAVAGNCVATQNGPCGAATVGSDGTLSFSGMSGTYAISSVFTITTDSPLPSSTVGLLYSEAITTASATGNVTACAITAGSLPAGLSAAPTGTTCVITGTPTTVAISSFTLQATDSASNTATQAFAVTINAAPVISTASPLSTSTVSSAFTQTLAATGDTLPLAPVTRRFPQRLSVGPSI